ncbi:DUF4422 domain-containing protein, partial [bacterium]|nr:DUF4422 domain-containing protein [bacterium]
IKNIVKKINHYDIIVPFKIISEGSLFISLESQYKHCHIPEDFDTLKNVLYALYPEYKEYDYIFTKKHLFFMR